MKQAIVAVGFGVGDAQVKKRCIDSLLEDLHRSFGKDYDIYEAWTSDFLRRKMAKEGYIYPNLAGVLEDLKAQGYEIVAIMPTHLTPGEEWQKKIMPVLKEYEGGFQRLGCMEPVLTAASPEEFAFIAEDIQAFFQLEDLTAGEELVLMGHGSPHYHNPVYEYLQSFADQRKWPVHIGVVEPEDYPNQQDVIDRLLAKGCQKVYLRPLLLAGGNHATYDLAGDQEDSWKNRLSQAGLEVRYSTKGLGEYEAFRSLYVKKLASFLHNFQTL